jgi:hypothetical protein
MDIAHFINQLEHEENYTLDPSYHLLNNVSLDLLNHPLTGSHSILEQTINNAHSVNNIYPNIITTDFASSNIYNHTQSTPSIFTNYLALMNGQNEATLSLQTQTIPHFFNNDPTYMNCGSDVPPIKDNQPLADIKNEITMETKKGIGKKRRQFTPEYKAKIVTLLETHTRDELQEILNIDRRVIGKWAQNHKQNNIINNNSIPSTTVLPTTNILDRNNANYKKSDDASSVCSTTTINNPIIVGPDKGLVGSNNLDNSGKRVGRKPFPRDPLTGNIIRPLDSLGNPIIPKYNKKKNKENIL